MRILLASAVLVTAFFSFAVWAGHWISRRVVDGGPPEPIWGQLQLPKDVLAYCAGCTDPILDGQEVVIADGQLWCSDFCRPAVLRRVVMLEGGESK